MDWRLQILKQATFARVPFGRTARTVKRRLFGYEPDEDSLRDTLGCLERIRAAVQSTGRSLSGRILEIGSGWFPTIPILLALDGSRVVMTDVAQNLDATTFAATLRFLRSTFPQDPRLSAITWFTDLPITYEAPFRASQVEDASLDFVISVDVLEHVPTEEMVPLLTSLRPKLKPGGLMVHLFDNSDHFEHHDKSRTKISFLTWSEREYAAITKLRKNVTENRLRHHEYEAIFNQAGFRVVSQQARIHEQTRSIAKALPLSPPYCWMSAEQLAAVQSLYVLAPDNRMADLRTSEGV